jgi:hypothetical protein
VRISVACDLCGKTLTVTNLSDRKLLHYCPVAGREESFSRISKVRLDVCSCTDRESGMKIINDLCAFGGLQYTGKPFVYCPWCGELLPE